MDDLGGKISLIDGKGINESDSCEIMVSGSISSILLMDLLELEIWVTGTVSSILYMGL